jgi:glycine/D-amino acid oxidase-like deaminating enzyme
MNEFVVIGGGIAGAAAGYFLAPYGFGDAPLLNPRGALVLVPPDAGEEFDRAVAGW